MNCGKTPLEACVENAVSIVEKLIRILKGFLQTRLNRQMPLGHMYLPWLVQRGPFFYNRFQVGADGKTPFTRSRGKSLDKPMLDLVKRFVHEL